MKKEKCGESYSYCLEDKFEIENIKNRRLFINYEIDEGVIDNIVFHILRYNRLDKNIPKKDRQPIILYLNSPGGSVSVGFGLIDAILSSITPVYTVNLAACYSMAFLIFLAGDKRYSMPNSTYLCHDGVSMAWDSTNKLKDKVEFETGQMEEHTKQYILSRTHISEEQYSNNKRKEWYFYSDEAKSLGVVTDIVGEDCTIEDII